MSQYLLLVWHDDEYEVDFESDDSQRIVAQVMAFNGSLQSAEALVFAGGLQPASSAIVVRSGAAGHTEVDGPYVEAKEQMGGFWIVEAADIEIAKDWARKAADACERPVELRPLQG